MRTISIPFHSIPFNSIQFKSLNPLDTHNEYSTLQNMITEKGQLGPGPAALRPLALALAVGQAAALGPA